MTKQRGWFEKLIILAIVAYISPAIATVIFGAWILKYVYDLGRNGGF
jgi:hypothetical protein